jgi:hypothetical protein
MAAIAPIVEKSTSTLPLTIIEGSGMDIILTVELGLKAGELNALWFLGVAFRFCNFADHTRIHDRLLLNK